MKKWVPAILFSLILTGGCFLANCLLYEESPVIAEAAHAIPGPASAAGTTEFTSRFSVVTEIGLSDDGIAVNGGSETDTVYLSHDIVYYEDRDTYANGSPYGLGTEADRHTAREASAHTVVNITAPGAYRLTGQLSAGQIRIDLGDNAVYNPNAVVELILSDAQITCTVAPAILFLNTYECDGQRTAEDTTPRVDTAAAGSNLILEGSNTVNGSHVARIFKNNKKDKTLWKQDGAIFSYTSMNVYGPGSLDLTATNEGMDSKMHLTINGGDILIKSQDDGINVTEEGISTVTLNGGTLTLYSGLAGEGDGIDSNGFVLINGGSLIASVSHNIDTGVDADHGAFVQKGFLASFGPSKEWVSSSSRQATMLMQFSSLQAPHARISVTREDGTAVCSIALEGELAQPFSSLILSDPALAQGDVYHVYVDGVQVGGLGVHQPGVIDGQWADPPGWGFGDELFAPDIAALSPGFIMTDRVNFFSGLTPI